MTTLEQLQALPDEKLIEKVAIEVMGWYKEHSHYALGVWNWEKAGNPVCVATDNRPMMGKQVWDPLTDWNHTMEVVEKMQTSGPGWAFDMVFPIRKKTAPVILCHRFRGEQSITDEPNPQRAICLAALLSLQ